MKYLIAGVTARTVADLVGIHRNSAVRFFHKLRVKIALKQQDRNEQFSGTVELDESYFGGVRKGKRGRGAAGKVAVFGIENFWNQAKRHMRKFNGIPRQHFNLFLKECEWRFNIGAPSKLLVDLKSLLKESY